MRVDRWLSPSLKGVAVEAQAAEARGFDAVWVPETVVDPFISIALASTATARVDVGIGVAVAFARSPMTVAQAAWNLQDYSGGRLILGLGPQVRAHIEKRYSMAWSQPAARMREYVLALRTIWNSWQTSTSLNFVGDFYTHTLMTPFFDPGPIPTSPPRVFLAAVGTQMTRVASEVADGMLVHSLCTPAYVRDVTVPALEAGWTEDRRGQGGFELSQRVFVVTGTNEEETQKARDATRKQVAFYASTPAYRPILDHHGWGAMQEELNVLSKRGEWDKMTGLISDGLLEEFAVVAEPAELAGRIVARSDGLVDRVTLYTPYGIDPELPASVLTGIKELSGPRPT